MSRLRISNPILALLTFLVIVIVVATWIFWPRHAPLSGNSQHTGYYWGNDGWLGRHYYRLHCDEGLGLEYEVDFHDYGWNRCRGWYPDGSTAFESEINVTKNGRKNDPNPDLHHVRWGKYFRPDGTLSSEIVDGTGIQTLWHPNGEMRWRLKLQNFKRVTAEQWDASGKRLSDVQYNDDGTEKYLPP